MSLTPDELARRRSFITATDVPAILGLSPWRNAADVYMSKVHGVETPSNKAMEAGTLLESSVMKWAETQLGPIHLGDWRVAENGINAASLDGTLADGGDVVEGKTSGITGPGNPYQWGEPGTDEIPDYYLLQVQTQLLCTGKLVGWVPALIGGRGFVMFRVEANIELHQVIETRSAEFWSAVQAKTMPDQLPRLETLKYLRREPGKVVDIPSDIAAAYVRAKITETDAVREAEEAQRRLLAAIGDAEACRFNGGGFTYYEQKRKGYTVQDSSYRVLRKVKEKA
jgi:putative phage-type endonuclease